MIAVVKHPVTPSIAIAMTEDVDHVTRTVRQLADEIGFSKLDANLIASATSELAMNIVLHAGHGVVRVLLTPNGRGLEVTFTDNGPGIADLDQARKQGYSSRADGLGLGLTAASKAVDQFEISSDPKSGTRATIRHYCPPDAGWFDLGIVSIEDSYYPCNGDLVYSRTIQGDTQLVAVIDGIGQGHLARQTALCVRSALEATSSFDPCELVHHAHNAVKSRKMERGFTIALLLACKQRLRLVTVGDVACRIFNVEAGSEPYRFKEIPGTLGNEQEADIKEQIIDTSNDDAPLLAILASDGVSRNFACIGEAIIGSSYDIASRLMHEFRNRSGDATIAALRIN